MDDLPRALNAYLAAQTELAGVNISSSITDIRQGEEKAIGLTVTDKDGTLNYGGSTGETRQVITLVSVAQDLNESTKMGVAISRLNGFGGLVATVPLLDDNGQPVLDLENNPIMVEIRVLSIILADSNRTNLDDGIVQTTYSFNVIRG